MPNIITRKKNNQLFFELYWAYYGTQREHFQYKNSLIEKASSDILNEP